MSGSEGSERLLRGALDAAQAAGDQLRAFQLGFDLAGYLLMQGQSREAFGINEQLPDV